MKARIKTIAIAIAIATTIAAATTAAAGNARQFLPTSGMTKCFGCQLSRGRIVCGTLIYPNGDKYLGEIKQGKRHGTGMYVFADGTAVKGIWKQDKYFTGGYLSDGERNGQPDAMPGQAR